MGFQERSYTSQHNETPHRIYYSDWGAKDAAPIVCVHGLTGNGFDFDYLAPALVELGHRVIAVDLPGRGRSDFLADPLGYNYLQYIEDLEGLLEHIGLEDGQKVDWIGVSLGGLLGIRMAAGANSRINRLILNDVGPEVPKAALDFIYQVVSKQYRFDTIKALETRMRETRGLSWGPLTDEQWRHMAEYNARALKDGSITYAYDHHIAQVFKTNPVGEINLWPLWDEISVPVLLLRGSQSLILPAAIVEKMRGRGPDFKLVEFGDCGHVPSLMADNHIEAITKWLKQTKG